MNQKISKFLNLAKPGDVEVIDSLEKVNNLKSALCEKYGFYEVAYPNSIWGVSHPQDVARSEEATFICSHENLGPFVNVIDPTTAKQEVEYLFDSCMHGRTAFVVPYVMGPKNSKYSRYGVTITDSPYVVVNMSILNKLAPEILSGKSEVVYGFHSTAKMDVSRKRIFHFLDELEVYSINTNYGGNVLTGKKCFSLRIASYLGKKEGWLAEHMLISVIQTPNGEELNIIGAFPSACGKTNFAMLQPPTEYLKQGWRVFTVGDDISWIFPEAGCLKVINPEYGFFGVAPGTSKNTNNNFWLTFTKGDSVFTNTALDLDKRTPWWEGCGEPLPARLINWQGQKYESPLSSQGPFAHPNSRITAPISNCPSLYPNWNRSDGHRVDAIIFGCRRSTVMPLIFEARSWEEGIYFAACLKSEKTAAQEGVVGVLRHDPFAMRPFFSYHIGDYLNHWLDIGTRLNFKPKIYFVNWFLKNSSGRFAWPGFSENIRIIEWINKRVRGECDALECIFGYYPLEKDLNLPDGVVYNELFNIDKHDVEDEILENGMILRSLGNKCPREINDVQSRLLAKCSNF